MNKQLKDNVDLPTLLNIIPNRFLLTVAVAKRARQLDDGATPLIDCKSSDLSLDIALMEIQCGKIVVSLEDETAEDSILDEISEYLDSDILKPLESEETKPKELQKKRKLTS
jgi:DNA-directed RNA polymerase subunit omega